MKKKQIIRLVGVPLLTLLFFLFESTDPVYYRYVMIWSCLMALILWEGNGMLAKLLEAHYSWRKNAGARIVVQLTSSLLFTLWLTFLSDKILHDVVYNGQFSYLIFKRDFSFFALISILYNAIYSGEHFFREWRKSLVEAEKLKTEQLAAQYEMLRNQVNPHFLFNSINTLIGLIQEDKELAVEYGHEFAKVYRYVLEQSKKELVSLEDELGLIKTHITLLKARFGDQLKINLNIDEIQGYLLPPLTLQMLLENAIKHNIINKQSKLKIDFVQKADKLVISNNINRKKLNGTSTGLGLDNIRKRFNYLSDREVTVEESENVFRVILPLLLENVIHENADH